MSEFLGKTIGEYQLVEVIDESGAALVYKGFQPSMNRYVAVKVLKPGAARDAATAQRFLQSAELAARMQHPNILPVYDSGQAEGVIYRVSPFVEGGTLRDNLAWFHDPPQALELSRQLVAALEYIHGQGYVHGNLKSSNVFLDAQHRPLLSDFGIIQPPSGAPNPYISPEQMEGGVVDRRADVYALGVLLYEMLVGEAPPPGAVVSPRAKRPDLPEAVERVIFKAMAQNPDQRFQSATEFQNALQSALHAPAPPPTTVPAPPPTPTVSQSVQVEQPKGTNWVAIVLGVLLVCAVCVSGSFLIVPRLLGASETEPVEGQPPTQPPIHVTVEIPTLPPRPTRPPIELPTKPPEPPTQEPPPEQPTQEPPEQLPEQPPEQPPDEPGGGLPDICGSLGLAGGIVVMGGTMASRRRRRL